MIKSQNKIQKFGVQVTFILNINHEKFIFLLKYHNFFSDFGVHFEPLSGWKFLHPYATT